MTWVFCTSHYRPNIQQLILKSQLTSSVFGQPIDLLTTPLDGESLCLFIIRRREWEAIVHRQNIFQWSQPPCSSLHAFLKKLSVLTIKPLCRRPQIFQQCRLGDKIFSVLTLPCSNVWQLVLKNPLPNGMLGQSTDLLSAVADTKYLYLFVVQQEKWKAAVYRQKYFLVKSTASRFSLHTSPKKLSVLALKPLRCCSQIFQRRWLRDKNFLALTLTCSDMRQLIMKNQLPDSMLGQSADTSRELRDSKHPRLFVGQQEKWKAVVLQQNIFWQANSLLFLTLHLL